MNKPNISDHFKSLGAALRNDRNSWGAVRDDERAVFLRVWMHEGRTIEGKSYYTVLRQNRPKLSNGHKERIEHLDRIGQGAQCYLIACRAVNENADEKRIKSFDGAYVWSTGKIIEHDGDLYIEAIDRIPARELMLVVNADAGGAA